MKNKWLCNPIKAGILIISSLAIFTISFSSCGSSTTESKQTTSVDTTKLKTGDVFYQCEMNSEVISDKAGTCPKCGMDLVKVEKK